MSSIDATTELLRVITQNLRDMGQEWDSYSAVIDVEDAEMPAKGSSALLYTDAGYLGAAGVKLRPIAPAVRTYMDSYYAEGERWPVKLLVQYNRRSGQYQVLFEESDTSRWEITPSNLEEIRAELKPTFG